MPVAQCITGIPALKKPFFRHAISFSTLYGPCAAPCRIQGGTPTARVQQPATHTSPTRCTTSSASLLMPHRGVNVPPGVLERRAAQQRAHRLRQPIHHLAAAAAAHADSGESGRGGVALLRGKHLSDTVAIGR